MSKDYEDTSQYGDAEDIKAISRGDGGEQKPDGPEAKEAKK